MAAALQEPHASTWRDVVARKLNHDTRLAAQQRAASLYQQWCDNHGDAHPNLCSYRKS
jgi:hypothetical protein